MSPLGAMFVGYAIVIGGLFVYVLRLHRIGRAIETDLQAHEHALNPSGTSGSGRPR
ncbi:MAG TPA: hypothetical protein VJA65_02620 [bacterium]|nr:hypothetical protein [bacterium]